MTTGETTLNAETQPMWRLVLGIVDRPTATFKAVLARRQRLAWAAPVLIVLVCFVIMTLVSAPYTLELAREQALRQLDSMPPEQAEAARASVETFTSLPVILATGLGFGTLLFFLGLLAQAALLYFGALVAGGEVNFGQVFTISAWTRLPFAIGFLTQAIFVGVFRRMILYPGLATLVATGDFTQDSRNPLVALLGRVDLFWLWHLLLVVGGLAVVARFSRSKSLVLTLVYTALSLAAIALPSLLFGGAAGA
jgi:hypothetical protein